MKEILNMNATFFLDEDAQQSGHELAVDSWMSRSNGVSVADAAKGLTSELMAMGATEGGTAQASGIYGALKVLIEMAGIPTITDGAAA